MSKHTNDKRTTCYHCHENQAAKGSVFCDECKPDKGSMPAIIQEPRDSQERPGKTTVRDYLRSWIIPRKQSAELMARLHRTEKALQDCEQANLALRNRHRALRAENLALTQCYDELEAERNDLAFNLGKSVADLRSMVGMYDDRTRERDELRKQFNDLTALYSEMIHRQGGATC